MIVEARPLVSRRQNALSIPTQLADVGLREDAPGTAERPGLGGIGSRRARAFPIASPHSSIVEGGCAFAAWSHPRFACMHPSTSSSSRVIQGRMMRVVATASVGPMATRPDTFLPTRATCVSLQDQWPPPKNAEFS
eukprot:scaffold180_cov134-Isochrysis_galbana.AAC.15